jgi:hypothetical protein
MMAHMLSTSRVVSSFSASCVAVALLLALAPGCDGDVTLVDSAKGSGGASNGECAPPSADCDGDPTDGCEADLGSDPANCGKCNVDCGGGACSSGVCSDPPVVLANGRSPRLLELNSTGVFFSALNATSTGGAIYRAAKDGSSVAPVTVESSILPSGLAVNDASVFWTESEYTCVDCSPDWGRVYTAPAKGGAPILLVETAGALPTNAVVDETHVYWNEYPHIKRVLIGGGNAETIIEGDVWIHELVVDKTRLYWTPLDVKESVIMSADKSGANQGPLCITSLRASQLTLDESWIYWLSYLDPNATTSRIERISALGGTSSVVLSEISPGYFAVHQGFVYWTELKKGRVLRAPVSGGSPEVLADGLAEPSEIAVDESGIYWLTGALSEVGAVMRLSLP